MPGIKALAALAAAALLGRVDARWSLHRLDAAAYPLARCLDGTPCVRLRACAHHSAVETERAVRHDSWPHAAYAAAATADSTLRPAGGSTTYSRARRPPSSS
jgi:hypothetical protein